MKADVKDVDEGGIDGAQAKLEGTIDPFDSLADDDFQTYLDTMKRKMRGPYMTKAEN